MAQINDVIISVNSSGGRQKVWSMEKSCAETKIWEAGPKLVSMLIDKLGSDIVLIGAMNSMLFEIIIKTFSAIEIVKISGGDWDCPKIPETKKRKLFMGWYDDNPLREWINKGFITKEDVIIVLGKDKDFGYLEQNCYCINAFMNVEGYLGLKFPECDKWHLIVKMHMGVVDEKVKFTFGINDCKCGYNGETFLWEEDKDV